MKLRKLFFMVALSAASLFLVNSSANAGALGLLSADGVSVNQLNGSKYQSLFNFNPDGTIGANDGTDTILNVGDVLFGYARTDKVFAPLNSAGVSPSTHTFTSLMFAEVTSIKDYFGGAYVPGTSNAAKVEFGALSSVKFANLLGAISTDLSSLTRNSTNSMVLVFDDSDSPDFIDTNPTNLSEGLLSAMNGEALFEFGISSALDSTDLWVANIFNDALDVTKINPANSASAALSVTSNSTNLTFETITGVGQPNGSGLYYLPDANVHLFNGTYALNDGDYGTKVLESVYFTVTPEPTSLAIWGIGALGFGMVRRRKTVA
ncbi:MAG: hypothetical protein COA78_32105 [Blastopirellula sp.]|nr:MAG: hypothetical protein COA78_32105 [Blastopirellula sp.]